MEAMKKQLPVRIEESTIEALKVDAESENRSLSNHVDTVLKKHLEKKEIVKPFHPKVEYGVSPLKKYLKKDENS